MQSVPKADATAVAVKMAPASIPVALKILGLTIKMYAMVINVVSPAESSVRTEVWFSCK